MLVQAAGLALLSALSPTALQVLAGVLAAVGAIMIFDGSCGLLAGR